MADNPSAYKRREARTRKDVSGTVRTPREKVTAVPLPRVDDAPVASADLMETAPEWSVENLPSQTAAVHFTPAAGEVRVILTHTLPPSRGVEAAIVSALVSLAKFARRKPGASLALAAAAGLMAGVGLRRI